MGNGQTLVLSTPLARARAHQLIERAPTGAVLNVREASRTSEQNAKMWAMLSDVSRAKPQGRVMPPEVWKCLFMSALGHQCTFEPSLDGQGVVPLGFKSSRLGKAAMSDLIESIAAYGAEHGVRWSDERQAA